MPSRIIPIILDENVDSAVGSFLEERGHYVQRVRELFAAMTKDEVIAVLGNENRAVIVTHDKDWKTLAPRTPRGSKQRFRELSRISLLCREPRARQRIEDLIETIEFEYEQAQRKSDKRLLMQISDTSFTVLR